MVITLKSPGVKIFIKSLQSNVSTSVANKTVEHFIFGPKKLS
jgi:hypothetical protein